MKIKKSWILSLMLVTCTLEAQTLPTVPVYTYTGVAYAGNGDLLTYSDSVMGTWSMQYDSLNRLESGTASTGTYQGLTLTWDYDSFGNRLSQIPSGTSNALVPGAITQAYDGKNHISGSSNGITSQSYDGAGNLTFDGLNFYAYDAENRVCVSYSRITASITQYIYDADGNRVAKLNATGTNNFNPNALTCAMVVPRTVQATYLLGQSGEQVTELDASDNWKHTNVYASGQLLATYDQEGFQQLLHFNIGDSLGTKRIQTTATGTVETTCQSLPYGDDFSCTGEGKDSTEHQFTGKERDTESGLDYFGARYYGSNLGRFTIPDWDAGPEPVPYANLKDPQTLNLYEYAENSPLSKRDGDGHVPCSGTASITINVNSNGTGNVSQSADDCPTMSIWQTLVWHRQVWADHWNQRIDYYQPVQMSTAKAEDKEQLLEDILDNLVGEIPAPKAASAGNMQKQVEKGQAPRNVDRVDKGRGPFEQDHIHFEETKGKENALNRDGTWKHGGRPLSSDEQMWITKNGWNLPKE